VIRYDPLLLRQPASGEFELEGQDVRADKKIRTEMQTEHLLRWRAES